MREVIPRRSLRLVHSERFDRCVKDVTASDTACMPRIAVPALVTRLADAARRAPLVVGHRGSSATHPENTLVAFRRAIQEGAQLMEFDVHATRDGHLVVIHDETLDRTTDARTVLGKQDVAVKQTDLAVLRELDAGGWKARRFRGARVPTLTQALALLAGRTVPMIEHKGGAARLYLRTLAATASTERVILQSFDWNFVARVRDLAPEVALGALGEGELSTARLRAARNAGAHVVHWDVDALRAEDVERIHALGMLVCVYTANSDSSLCGAARLGVDAITTNVPARLTLLEQRGIALRTKITRR